MPRASRTATKAEETEQAVNSTAETEKPQETANTNATEERFIYIGPTTNTGLVENTIFTGNRETVEKYLEPTIEKLPQVRCKADSSSNRRKENKCDRIGHRRIKLYPCIQETF